LWLFSSVLSLLFLNCPFSSSWQRALLPSSHSCASFDRHTTLRAGRFCFRGADCSTQCLIHPVSHRLGPFRGGLSKSPQHLRSSHTTPLMFLLLYFFISYPSLRTAHQSPPRHCFSRVPGRPVDTLASYTLPYHQPCESSWT
jgi:hypothetical protein